MTKLPSWQCHCGRKATLECDWPTADNGHCNKGICEICVRRVDGLDICPYHRGDPPATAERKAREAAALAEAAGRREAENAARILGVPWPPTH